jgi:hypothetical protein
LRLPDHCCSLTWLADLLQDCSEGALLLQGQLLVYELESDPRIGCLLHQPVADVLLSLLFFQGQAYHHGSGRVWDGHDATAENRLVSWALAMAQLSGMPR